MFTPGGDHAWEHTETFDSEGQLLSWLEKQVQDGLRPVFFKEFVKLWNTPKQHEDDMGIVIIRGSAIVPEPEQVVERFKLPKTD